MVDSARNNVCINSLKGGLYRLGVGTVCSCWLVIFPTGYFLQEDVGDLPSCIQRPECEVRSVADPAVAGILAQVWKSGEE